MKHLKSTCRTGAAILVAAVTLSAPALADEQAAIDGCIDQLRVVGGPDGQSGQVISSEYSEAATLVMLRDAGETVWRCLAYNDGTVAEMSVTQAMDDGAGAVAGAKAGAETATERVRFKAGTIGAELTGDLMPGASVRYVIGAKSEQFLYFRLAANGPNMFYQIFNPDGSFLLEQMTAEKEYRGQLWQSGDHVVEVINRGNGAQSFNVIFGIE